MNPEKIWISPPHLTGEELDHLESALATNWVAPGGPCVKAFESAIADFLKVDHALAVSSGTAALHLAYKALGVGPGDTVICSTFSYIASVNPVHYVGAEPFLVDCESKYWQMCPAELELAIESIVEREAAPAAVLVADNYGQTADYEKILSVCARYDIPVIEDAAQALGARCHGAAAGALGRVGALSFNGNKIITASGGGMLVSNDGDLIDKARHLANQASNGAGHYRHSEIGFNYGFSNVLAALGCAQFKAMPERLAARKRNFDYYKRALQRVPGLTMLPRAPYGTSNHWLNCVRVDPVEYGASRDDIIEALSNENIESRPTWVPIHLQAPFNGVLTSGGRNAEAISSDGLCLPSGSSLRESDLGRIVSVIIELHESMRRSGDLRVRREIQTDSFINSRGSLIFNRN